MSNEPLIAEIAGMLEIPDERIWDIRLEPCNFGGNNRAFVVSAGDRKLVAKWYFSHPSDARDRLHAEYSFLGYAARIGIGCVPRPVSCDPARNLALYEYIEGERISTGQVSDRDVTAALEFFLALNRASARPHAATLPNASEACFSVNKHLALVDMRIGRLMTIAPAGEVDTEACAFAAALEARWQAIKAGLARRAQECGIKPDEALPEHQRCISPSDFGFHNALRRPSGEVCFLDFEYAGWDDPAKITGDFFCHPAIPVEHSFRDHFIATAMTFCAEQEALRVRAELLFPVFQTKWCCIILNDFLPDSARRRRFAEPDFDEGERKRTQLAKAKHLFDSIEER